jgi:hypothetical protein
MVSLTYPTSRRIFHVCLGKISENKVLGEVGSEAEYETQSKRGAEGQEWCVITISPSDEIKERIHSRTKYLHQVAQETDRS